jgi:hypothetical protein
MTRARGRPAGRAQSFPRPSADRATARPACPWTRGVRAWPGQCRPPPPDSAWPPSLPSLTARESARSATPAASCSVASAVGSLRPYGMAAMLARIKRQIGTAHAVTGALAAELAGAAGNGRSRRRSLRSRRSAAARGASAPTPTRPPAAPVTAVGREGVPGLCSGSLAKRGGGVMTQVTEHLQTHGVPFEPIAHQQAYTSIDEARALVTRRIRV